MFDKNVVFLQNLIEEEFKLLDEIDQMKNNTFKLKALLLEKYLFHGDAFVKIYDNYDDFSIKEIGNLLGYNRIINENGHFYEFYGIYIEFYNNNDIILNGYIILYRDKNKLCIYVPEKGNMIESSKPKVNNGEKIFLFKNKDQLYINFKKIKDDMYEYFFKNNDYIVNQLYDEDFIELLEAIKILSDNKNINNLIENFYKKHHKT